MNQTSETNLKQKQVFKEELSDEKPPTQDELTVQVQFTPHDQFIPAAVDDAVSEQQAEQQIEQVIRPKSGSRWLAAGLFTTFTGLITWQAIDTVMVAWQTSDWLALGWAGFLATIASLGIGAMGKELWKLRRLRNHFSVQEQSETLIASNRIGQGKAFCESIATRSGVVMQSPSFERWLNSVQPTHSDAEVLDMYDAMVIAEQDKKATKIVSQHATESAALVAISPLAVADMFLVAWRNFKMIDNLAEVYGIELGYWSRVNLFKATLVNMAVAGASELAVDASMDLLSMDLAGKVSARAGQGLGVGILTARLGLKAMSLLRPIPWQKERRVQLGSIRKQIVEKIAAITVK